MGNRREQHYWEDIFSALSTAFKGLSLSFKHLFDAGKNHKPYYVTDPSYFSQGSGLVTLQYPKEQLPLPEPGRYKLHNEIDDCIVCDKCAKACPVDCIDIDAIKATEEIGKASDGSSIRLYAAKFDIDMAKCCYCGLCTTVCPTECLTMTKDYDYSQLDVDNLIFHFAKLSEEEAEEKRREYEAFVSDKAAKKKEATSKDIQNRPHPKPTTGISEDDEGKKKPVFRPKVTPKTEEAEAQAKPAKPVFRPKVTPKTEEGEAQTKPAKPVFRPKVKPKAEEAEAQAKPAKPVFRPKVKPKAEDHPSGKQTSQNPKDEPNTPPKGANPSKANRPKPIIPKKPKNTGGEEQSDTGN